ncbi:hypothetical protein V5799_025004 [Amblyomma americanum]|uniref:Uncharacterized protein n=1 Tax=Amblyomma americanum TaxID=6943 RepID=A0AAQ4EAU2_AMBAM
MMIPSSLKASLEISTVTGYPMWSRSSKKKSPPQSNGFSDSTLRKPSSIGHKPIGRRWCSLTRALSPADGTNSRKFGARVTADLSPSIPQASSQVAGAL